MSKDWITFIKLGWLILDKLYMGDLSGLTALFFWRKSREILKKLNIFIDFSQKICYNGYTGI